MADDEQTEVTTEIPPEVGEEEQFEGDYLPGDINDPAFIAAEEEGEQTAESPADEEPPVEDGLTEEEREALKPHYSKLVNRLGKQANELGDLRRRVEEQERILAQRGAPGESAAGEAPAEESEELPATGQAYINRLFADEEIRRTAFPEVELRVNELQDSARESMENLGWEEGPIIEELERRRDRHWRRAWNEKLPAAGQRIYGERKSLVAETPRQIRATIDQVFKAEPVEGVTADELDEALRSSYTAEQLASVPQAGRANLVAMARDLLIARKYREGKLSGAPAPKPDPAPVPNTGPTGGAPRNGGGVTPALAGQIADLRAKLGKAAVGMSDETLAKNIKSYRKEI